MIATGGTRDAAAAVIRPSNSVARVCQRIKAQPKSIEHLHSRCLRQPPPVGAWPLAKPDELVALPHTRDQLPCLT